MAQWSLPANQKWTAQGINLSNCTGTSITCGASNAKGSYAQLVASTPHPAHGIIIMLCDSPTSGDYLLDLALGGSGAEQVIVANLKADFGSGSDSVTYVYEFPVLLASGQRLSMRGQNTNATTQAVKASVMLRQSMNNIEPTFGRITTYGANTADSGGVSVDPGGSANTKGAYSEVVLSTTNDLSGLVLALGNQFNTVRTSCKWLIDVAVGAAGSEKIIIPDLLCTASAANDTPDPCVYPFMSVQVASGSRLSVRAACSITDATDRLFDVVIYGVS